MDPTYDETNRGMMPVQPAPTPSKSGGIMDFIRNNKILVIIIILIIIGLIYWFCIRKNSQNVTTNITTPGPSSSMNPSKINVTRTRSGSGSLF